MFNRREEWSADRTVRSGPKDPSMPLGGLIAAIICFFLATPPAMATVENPGVLKPDTPTAHFGFVDYVAPAGSWAALSVLTNNWQWFALDNRAGSLGVGLPAIHRVAPHPPEKPNNVVGMVTIVANPGGAGSGGVVAAHGNHVDWLQVELNPLPGARVPSSRADIKLAHTEGTPPEWWEQPWLPPQRHTPELSWDIPNNTGQAVNDFEIIVSADYFSPPSTFDGPFSVVDVDHGDFHSNPGNETRIRFSGATVNPGEEVHLGLDMLGSERILDAFWTENGTMVGASLPIVNEITEVVPGYTGVPGEAAIFMDLMLPEETQSGFELRNIRTFMDIPASMLSLSDLNDELDLSTLASFETNVGLVNDIELSAVAWSSVGVGISSNLGPDWESLLVADIFDGQGAVTGTFWNLNVQSPEPGTLSLLALGGLALLRRRRA